jgi:two-component system, OmpR family, KDP operon response regulator KdpE
VAAIAGERVAQPRILVVEDDTSLRRALVAALDNSGFRASAAANGADGLHALTREGFDVVLLDIMLPFVDGWQLLDRLEGRRRPAVIVISARGDEHDKVRALDMGADDYLAKPFGAPELLARVRAVLRRSQPIDEAPAIVRDGRISVDLGKRTVFKDGVEVRLSPTEYLLVAELARHSHRVRSYRELLQAVWGPEYADERHYLRTFVQRLRVKLEENPPRPMVIQTVPGRGYRFGSAS